MQKFSYLIGLFFLFVTAINAQLSPDCRNAIPICADGVGAQLPLHQSIADGKGDIDDFDPDVIIQTGCLEKGSISSANIENNTVWYVFRAGTDGQVGFDIEATTLTAEWDFAVYGPDVDCVDISSGDAQPVRCNYEVNNTNFTGIGINPDNGQVGMPNLTQSLNTYDEWLDVVEGEVYYILINNFNINTNNDPESFTFTFTGSSVASGQDTAIDCTLRDEFLGLDIDACVGADDIVLSALRSPVGNDIDTVVWSVDYEDDGVIDDTNLMGSGLNGAELIIPATLANSGRYFVVITTSSRTPPTVEDGGGVLVTFFDEPVFDEAATLATVISNIGEGININTVEIIVDGTGDYEYSLNGSDFQDNPLFYDAAPGENNLIINDKNACGTLETTLLIIGYPKFFTPNNDFVNDTWNVKGIERLTNPSVFIFDRYGKLLKQLNQVGGWDGTFNGARLPSSDYWFRLEYTDIEDGVAVNKVRKGHFSLKR